MTIITPSARSEATSRGREALRPRADLSPWLLAQAARILVHMDSGSNLRRGALTQADRTQGSASMTPHQRDRRDVLQQDWGLQRRPVMGGGKREIERELISYSIITRSPALTQSRDSSASSNTTSASPRQSSESPVARRSPKKVSISPSPRTSRRASPRPPPSPRLSRSPSPHPVKNQRCASQPSHMTKPNVAVVVSNWRKRSLTELKDTANKMRSLNTLTPRSILSPRSSDTRSRTPSPQSRTSPGRVQFSEESSRRSSTSYKAFFGLSRRSARAKGQTQTPSPRSPRSPVPPVSHARCVSQPAHLSKSNLETLGENKSV